MSRVTLHCEAGGAVWVEESGRKYGLNGLGKMFLGAEDTGLENIWRVGTVTPRVNIGPMIDEDGRTRNEEMRTPVTRQIKLTATPEQVARAIVVDAKPPDPSKRTGKGSGKKT